MGNDQSNSKSASPKPPPPTSQQISNEDLERFQTTFNTSHTTQESKIETFLNTNVPDSFEFNLDQFIGLAKQALSNDADLANIRHKLVPAKIREDQFWRTFAFLLSQETTSQSQTPTLPLRNDTQSKSFSSPTTSSAVQAVPLPPEIVESKRQSSSSISSSATTSSRTSSPPQESTETSESKIIEEIVLTIPVVWVYTIPPRTWRGRHNRASDWDLEHPIFIGKLLIVREGDSLRLRFIHIEQPKKKKKGKKVKLDIRPGDVFLESISIPLSDLCDETPLESFFDMYGVVDSSRYFIFWTEAPTQDRKKVPFAIGMKARQDAFDIRAAVADQIRIFNRHRHFSDPEHDFDESDEENITIPQTGEFDLGEDEMIFVGKFKRKHGRLKASPRIVKVESHEESDEIATETSRQTDPDNVIILPPPPTQKKILMVDDDWTDFQSAEIYDDGI